ncbi:response regulator [Dyadobacter sp. NIV53]|uniref:response regulator n=1 Tax=Dyadobacter sp. NIV53 TaxID=2861765 RepID=UPI001E4AEEEE|nr:response regulator [Dyadobacter sp. NIV53]
MNLLTDLPGNVKTILLVEDNLLFRTVMNVSLIRAGYRCLLATSATEALQLLIHEEPDMIISDYDMPEMNGFDFRQVVLQNSKFCDIPFVFLTSSTDNSLMLEGLNMNALDFINKETPLPVIISKLGNIIKTLENEHLKSIRELRIAADALNVKSIPSKDPEIAGFRINFWHKGYRGYPGGDFIDFVKVNDQFCFAFLGDIMGKKWKAWFFTFGFLSYIRAAIRFCVLDNDFGLDIIVQKINKLIYLDEGLQNILSSLSLILIDSYTGKIHYTGAGDLPLISHIPACRAYKYDSFFGFTSRIVGRGPL